MPAPGFVACAAVEAAPRIAEAGKEASRRLEPVFINIVSHDAVQRPVLPQPPGGAGASGAPVPVEEDQSWSGACVHLGMVCGCRSASSDYLACL